MQRMLVYLRSQNTHRQACGWGPSVDVLFEQVQQLPAALLLKLRSGAHYGSVLQDERIGPCFALSLLRCMRFGIEGSAERTGERGQNEPAYPWPLHMLALNATRSRHAHLRKLQDSDPLLPSLTLSIVRCQPV